MPPAPPGAAGAVVNVVNGSNSEGKELVGKSNAPKRISQIQFGTLHTTDIQKVSEVKIVNRTIFSPADETNPQRYPSVDGK